MKLSTTQALQAAGLDPTVVERIVRGALDEDLGPERRDVTSVATVPDEQVDTADVVARADGVVAGLAVAAAVFDLAATRTVRVLPVAADGDRVARGDVLATVTGPTRSLLSAERTALNLLSRMSGVATHTRAWVEALAGTKATVLDTRKTTPGLRALEKYAVRAGGGANKRMGLFDVAMIKDNHKLAAGGIGPAYRRVREAFPDVPVQVEVTSVAEAVEALEVGADFLLCDNMTPALLTEVVAAVGDRAELEATGNLTLDTVAEYAATGVDYLSVGALTHSSPILDIALDLRPARPRARD
ncbi:carboxylating nicotinate-nucleotide diphosphorylase [Plantactinospora solaniradicis]|uniref:nicotinate-nucleotide diphosphorylase (carboxylating) n=1 Tax=Plantactinospora solaniradicis TaxID=1723736 RepID=A0ABW1K121_9ACTN